MHQLDKRAPNGSATISKLRVLKATGEGSSLQKRLKEELRMTIMAKRHARGQGDLQVDFPEPQSHELTMAELERRERRREQNRRAAQRCRRKKRMNQMSVIQNYEWIISRNQQLEQELDRLRQEKNQVQTLLKAHCQACTCAHSLTLLPHVLDAPAAVKVEPGEEPQTSPSSSTTTTTTTPSSSSSGGFGPLVVSGASESWRYNPGEGAPASCGAASVGQQSFGGQPQPGSYPSPTTFSTSSNSCRHAPCDRPHLSGASGGSPCSLNGTGESSPAARGTPPCQPLYSGGHSSLVPAVPYSPGQQQGMQGGMGLPVPMVPGGGVSTVSLLDELTYMPGGLRSCSFQEEAATPLSADGRRSISSVSSDVSAMSEHPDVSGVRLEEPGHMPPVGEFYVTDDVVTSGDVSQLLSQINQSDLLFQQEGGNLDEVFSDTVVTMTSLPDHFLQNL